MICPMDTQPCTMDGTNACRESCISQRVLDKLKPLTRQLTVGEQQALATYIAEKRDDTPKGVWFVYGRDTMSYPIGVFDDELEARQSMTMYNNIIFWEFGVPWDDLKS